MFSKTFFKGMLPFAMAAIGAELAAQGAGGHDAKALGSILVAAEPAVEQAIEGYANGGVTRLAMTTIRDAATAWLNANPQAAPRADGAAK